MHNVDRDDKIIRASWLYEPYRVLFIDVDPESCQVIDNVMPIEIDAYNVGKTDERGRGEK